MKPTVSRTKNKVLILLMVIFVALLLIGSLLKLGGLMYLSIALLISILILLLSNRCPYCNEPFRGVYWSKSDAGYCKKCGKLIEFDDHRK